MKRMVWLVGMVATCQCAFAAGSAHWGYEGSDVSIGDHRYALKQFHFHSPSENEIDGKRHPLEAHFVHADADGNLAVVAVMFEEGAENKALKQAWAHMPEKAGQVLKADATAGDLLPDNHDYYRYNGSLTTPPCTEGVTWLVMQHPLAASAKQIKQFEHVMHHPNNRPIQQANARLIMR